MTAVTMAPASSVPFQFLKGKIRPGYKGAASSTGYKGFQFLKGKIRRSGKPNVHSCTFPFQFLKGKIRHCSPANPVRPVSFQFLKGKIRQNPDDLLEIVPRIDKVFNSSKVRYAGSGIVKNEALDFINYIFNSSKVRYADCEFGLCFPCGI